MAAITADLSLDASQFANGLQRANSSLRTFKTNAQTAGRQAQRGMFGGFGRAANEAGELIAGALAGRSPRSLLFRQFDELAGVLGPAIAGGLAAVGIGTQVVGAVKRAMSAEQMEISMEVLIGDASKAQAIIEDLRKKAANTPYEFPDLAGGLKTLLGFGVAVDSALGDLDMLSEVAQGNAATLERLALVYGQISAAGRLMGQDNLQLINAGFNPLQVIAQKTGESMVELKKRMEQGGISFDEVREAFISVTGVGGRFYQMNARQSKTTAGLFSTLRDAWGEVQLAFGKPINDAIRPLIEQAIPLVASLKDEATAFGEAIRGSITTMVALFDAFTGAELGAMVLRALSFGFKSAVNVLWAGMNAAAAAGGTYLAGYASQFIELIDILNKPQFWDGLRTALVSAAQVFGAFLLESVARQIELLKRIPGVEQVIGSPEQGMRETATRLRQQSAQNFGSATDKLTPFVEEAGKALQARLAKVGEVAAEAYRNSSQIFDTSGEQAAMAADAARLATKKAALDAAAKPATPAAQQAQGASPAVAASVEGRPVGALASAINLIMGRSANELIYDEAKKQTAVQREMRDNLAAIKQNTAKPQQPARPVSIDLTPRFAAP